MSGDKKLIVLTGHGTYDPKTQHRAYAKVPGGCSFHIYTGTFTRMTEKFGQELEQGKLGSRPPSQAVGPYQQVPNMILTWPRGLTVTPAKGWHHIRWDLASGASNMRVPADERNILFQIKEPAHPGRSTLSDPLGHMYLDEIFDVLRPAIARDRSTLFVWSACRQVRLKEVQIDRRIVWNRETIDEFLDYLQSGGVGIPVELKLRMGSWPGRKMTMDDVVDEMDAGALIRSSADPAQAKETWDSELDDLFEFGAPRDVAWKREKSALKLNVRDETDEKFKRQPPPVPSRKGRPKYRRS
jgi:hypothetical protein